MNKYLNFYLGFQCEVKIEGKTKSGILDKAIHNPSIRDAGEQLTACTHAEICIGKKSIEVKNDDVSIILQSPLRIFEGSAAYFFYQNIFPLPEGTLAGITRTPNGGLIVCYPRTAGMAAELPWKEAMAYLESKNYVSQTLAFEADVDKKFIRFGHYWSKMEIFQSMNLPLLSLVVTGMILYGYDVLDLKSQGLARHSNYP